MGGWWCVCVCVLGGSVRRGCAYFRFRVHCEYISGIMSFGFNTLRCYPRVRHTVAASCGILFAKGPMPNSRNPRHGGRNTCPRKPLYPLLRIHVTPNSQLPNSQLPLGTVASTRDPRLQATQRIDLKNVHLFALRVAAGAACHN